MMAGADSDRNEQQVPSWRSVLFSWPGFFLAAWLVYELTAQAALSVTFLCVKFGWEEFRTALWLRRTDPDGIQGKIGFWIFFAGGLFKAAVVGVILMFATIAVDARNKVQAPP